MFTQLAQKLWTDGGGGFLARGRGNDTDMSRRTGVGFVDNRTRAQQLPSEHVQTGTEHRKTETDGGQFDDKE